MKGIAGIWIIAALAVILGGAFLTGSNLIGIASLSPASLVTPSDGCQILEGEYATYECKRDQVNFQVPLSQTQSYKDSSGFINILARCDANNVIEQQQCSLRLDALPQSPYLLIKVWGTSGNLITTLSSASQGTALNIPYRSQIQLQFGVSTFGIFQPATDISGTSLVLSYPSKSIYYSDTTGKGGTFGLQIGNGCDLTTLVGTEKPTIQYLEQGDKTQLSVGELSDYIFRFTALPYVGNYVSYNGQDSLCRQSSGGSVIYSLKKFTTQSNTCYATPEQTVGNVACCPGQTSPDGLLICNNQFQYVSLDKGDCFRGGIYSDLYCPGQGGWTYDSILTDQTRKTYKCDQLTANCVINKVEAASCNPSTNLGCSQGKICDAASLTCRDAISTTISCLEARYECCNTDGFNLMNVQPRTCADAGKPQQKCISGFCQSPPPGFEICGNGIDDNNDKRIDENPPCGNNLFGNLFALIIVGLIVSAILLTILRVVPVTRVLTQPFLGTLRNKAIFMGIVVVALILLGSPFLLSTASLVGL